MILANTKATGYSLGLPLFWPEDPTQLSSGIIQSISISLQLPKGTTIPPLFVDKYSISGQHVTLIINSIFGIVCSLDVSLSDTYTAYPLQRESGRFLGGWVGLYPQTNERMLNLNGAQINPMYVHAGYSTAGDWGAFTLVENTFVSGAVQTRMISAVNLAQLAVADSPDVLVTSETASSGGFIYSCTANDTVTSAEAVDSTSIYYVNGIPVSDGAAYLELPPTWVVMGNALCARVGNPSDTPSCEVVNVIQDTLGPQNFPGNNPLGVAFDENTGELDLSEIYAGTKRFNSEYEPYGNAGTGLVWSQYSAQHDVI